MTIHAYSGRSANDIYARLIKTIHHYGTEVNPRGTKTLELHPTVLEITDPSQRHVSSWGRPVNLAFALQEVIWILNGQQDVESLEWCNSQIKQFSDDGRTLSAAYGYRLRHAHNYDQIEDCIRILKDDPDSRQATMVMWHPDDRGWINPDEGHPDSNGFQKINKKDRACNLSSHVMIRDGKLDWTQFVRSNDVVLGLDYNFIQFMSLQEWMAGRLGVGLGKYTHISDSMHLYLDTYYEGHAEAAKIRSFHIEDYLPPVPPMQAEDPHSLWLMVIGARSDNPEKLHLWSDLVGPYWAGAYCVLASMARYKDKTSRDSSAWEWLEQAPPIFAALQAKFFMHHRWHKPEYEWLQVKILSWCKEVDRTGQLARWMAEDIKEV